MNSSSDEQLRRELSALGARDHEVVGLTMDSDRGLAALRLAQERGVERPIPYALHLFDAPDWNPSGEVRRRVTNAHVEVTCAHCGGDRFVPVDEDWKVLWGETYAPCIACNADVDTKRWVGDERRVTVAR